MFLDIDTGVKEAPIMTRNNKKIRAGDFWLCFIGFSCINISYGIYGY
jgi:hypothetical protein